jgi:hypothetical protein
VSHWKPLLVTLATWVVFVAPAVSEPAHAQDRGRGQAEAKGRGRGQALVPQGRGGGLRQSAVTRQMPRSYQEPAFARGYEAGHERGRADGKSRARYDPAGSADYRNADQGYAIAYGSRDAYRNNYRAGFRQGYEEGYRQATR